MPLRRTFSLRSLFSARFYQPSYSGISLRDNAHEEKPNYGSVLHQRCFGSSILSQHLRSSSRLSLRTPFGVSIYQRSMSTSHVPGSDESGNVNEVAGTDPVGSVMENVASQVPSDWSNHFEALIQTVHSYTGFNWWTSIVLTTLLIRGLTIPLMINTRRLMSMLMICSASMDTKDPAALARHSIEMDKLLKKYGAIRSLLSFWFLAVHFPALVLMGPLTINYMTGKVASFKTGGALWFTDLTTPDALIFPLLTGLTFWIMIECDAMVGVEGAMLPKKLARIMVIPMFVFGLYLSKAVHCYLMSCMLFSIAFTYVIRRHGVMKHFGIPEVPEYVLRIMGKRVYGKWYGKWFF